MYKQRDQTSSPKGLYNDTRPPAEHDRPYPFTISFVM